MPHAKPEPEEKICSNKGGNKDKDFCEGITSAKECREHLDKCKVGSNVPAEEEPKKEEPKPVAKPEPTKVEPKPKPVAPLPLPEVKAPDAKWTRMVAFTIAFIIIEIAVAAFYHSKKTDSTTPPEDGSEHSIALLQKNEFRYGLFDCLQVPSLTAFSFLCCPVRWADTIHMAGFMAFWAGASIMIGLGAASPWTSGLTIVLALIMAVYYRQKLRGEFEMATGTMKSIAEDIATYAFCPCLAVVQEARQLEEAYAVGHPIKKVEVEGEKKDSA